MISAGAASNSNGNGNTHQLNLMESSGASGSGMPEVILQGVPVPPDMDLSAIYSSPFFFSTSVWIPGEIDDPITISKLSNLNKFLVIQRKDFFNGVLQPDYIQFLQRELDVTPPELLPSKLDFLLNREYHYWYQFYAPNNGLRVPNHDWYINQFGHFIPSPMEPLVYDNWFLFFIGIIVVFSISLFLWLRKRKKRKNH